MGATVALLPKSSERAQRRQLQSTVAFPGWGLFNPSMFGCVTWVGKQANGAAFKSAIFAAVPDPKRTGYYLPQTVVFAVKNHKQVVDTRKELRKIRKRFPDFRYAVSFHDDLGAFGGAAYYKLTPAVRKAMGMK